VVAGEGGAPWLVRPLKRGGSENEENGAWRNGEQARGIPASLGISMAASEAVAAETSTWQ